jgi:hypothetical protein
MKNTIAAVAAAAALLLTLAGCASVPPAPINEPAPEASLAAPPEKPEVVPPPALDLLAFGEAMTWEDGIQLSVSEAAPFTPGEYAAGVIAGQPAIVFTLVITNNSDAVLEPMAYGTLSSGGQEASEIFDMGNPIGEIGGSPSTAILPGQTVQWLEAYSVVDPANLTFQVSPTFSHEDAIFTNVAP